MKEIAIIGAGIAGLTTAHALIQAGYDVRVFERADELRALGAGITMQANAMAALESIGLAELIKSAGYPIDHGHVSDWKGKVITEIDGVAISKIVHHMGYSIHRARLIDLLARGLDDVLEFGAGALSAENIDDGARLALDDGRSLDFAAVIGSDGIHSAIRESLFGEEPLRYAGYTTWRGVAKMSSADVVFTEMWGPARRFGLVPISDDEVYWFAVDEAPEGETSNEPVMAKLQNLFGDWGESVSSVLECTESEDVVRTDSHDRPPMDVWGEGRITLLGDAAHAMTPNLGQGGGQAVESAVVLGRVLAQTDDIEAGFRRYEALRKERAHHFVKQSWTMGRIAQWKNGVARALRDFGMRMAPKSTSQKMLVDLYDFEGWYDDVVGKNAESLSR